MMSKWRVLAVAQLHSGFWRGGGGVMGIIVPFYSVQDCYFFDQGHLTTQLLEEMMISEKNLFLRGTTNFEQGK